MRNRHALAVTSILLCLVGVPLFAGTSVTTTGSTTVLPISQLVSEALAPQGIDLTVSGGGSGVGITAIIDGTTQIAASSRAMTLDEFRQAVDNGVTPYVWEIAIDAIAIVVHPSNPIARITYDQLSRIYLGQVTNWKELGGPDLRIVVVSRDTSSGTYGTFNELVLGKQGVMAGALYQSSNGAVASTVAETPGAIGYVGLGYLQPALKALDLAKTDAGPFVTPDVATAITFDYPLSRPLYYVTNGFPTGAVAQVINFILSDAGQQLVLETGYAPIRGTIKGS
jgi:phosphate transport system substrate-binding protein